MYTIIMSSITLLDSCRKYEKSMRKSRTKPMSFQEYNDKYNTTLPTSLSSQEVENKFIKSLLRARKQDGIPVRGKLFNIYKRLSENASITLNSAPLKTKVNIPPPTNTIAPSDVRMKPVVLERKIKKPTTLTQPKTKRARVSIDIVDQYKKDLSRYIKKNSSTKLKGMTQVVYFVPPEPVKDFEHFSAKLTRTHGQILETGGTFKMINKKKRNIMGINMKEAKEVIASVTAGEAGPFFVNIACPTGAKNCGCH